MQERLSDSLQETHTKPHTSIKKPTPKRKVKEQQETTRRKRKALSHKLLRRTSSYNQQQEKTNKNIIGKDEVPSSNLGISSSAPSLMK